MRHRIIASVVLSVALLVAWAIPSFAQPVWRIDGLSNTTAAPGDSFTEFVQVSNVGDTTSDGSEFDVTISLPAGLTAVSWTNGPSLSPFSQFSCSGPGGVDVAGQTTITCSDTASVPFDNVQSFEAVLLTVAVDAGTPPGTVTTTTLEVSGGGAPSASSVDPIRIAAPPTFGLDAFDGQVTSDAAGDPFTQAGGHPYAASASIDFNTITNPNPAIGALWPVEAAKDVLVDLPPGLIGNPTIASRCTASELANSEGPEPKPLCPPSSQVGTTIVRANNPAGSALFGPVPVFNMVPPPGVPARFGFNVAGTLVTLDGALRSASDYGLSVNVENVSEGLALAGTTLTFWGVPSDPSHDFERACPGQMNPWRGGLTCASGASRLAFLRNPTACTASGVGLPTTVRIDSWLHPGTFVQGSFDSHLPPAYPAPPFDWGTPQGPTGCDKVPFDPKLIATPATPARAGTPSGFTFDLTLPQNSDPAVTGEADLKKAVVTLPQGVRVSPSSAAGLGACSQDQIGLHSTDDPTCPDSSKVGSLTIDTPLLDQQLTGSVYLATPHDNPFGSLIALYLVAKGPGLIVKVSGSVQTDPNTGQLTATFDNNPQTPFSKLHLELNGGPRAPIVTPDACGTYTTHAVLTSWSGATVNSDSDFTLSQPSDGSACAPAGFSPGFAAGTQQLGAGKDSMFLLQLTRSDRDQEFSTVSVDLPAGLLGRIANTVLCPDGAASAGSCTDGSQVGSVTVGAGPGTNPFYITSGRAYLTGPYKGAPFGLSIVVPAVAGPFDLGNVVVRAALFVDRTTAQVKVVSDPLPTILQGIPLDVRDVRVLVDKPHFIVNPTSCSLKHVAATVGSTQGAIAHVSMRFAVTDCANLALAPKLSLTIGAKGHTRAGVSTPVTATLTMPPGDSNLRVTSVTLPGTLNARLPVVNRACSLAAFEAGHCGDQSKAGTAVAVTPLLRDPLRGGVYFVKNPKRVLPDLMVALRGQVALDVTAKVSIPGGKRLGTRFDTIPDAPITKFTLRIVSGKNGPVGIVTNLCSAKGRSATAAVGFRGQNGALVRVNQRVHVNGCAKASNARKARG